MHSPLMLESHNNEGPLYIFTTILGGQRIEATRIYQQNEVRPNIVLADIYIFNCQNTYYSRLTSSHLNHDLKWNVKSVDLLTEALSGKRGSASIQFVGGQKSGLLKLLCELDNGIGVWLLEMRLQRIQGISPFQYLGRLCRNERDLIEEREHMEILECNFITKQIQALDAQTRLTKDNHYFGMEHRKNQFLAIINKVKKRTSKIFGNSIIEEVEEKSQTSEHGTRKIFKANRESMEGRKSVNDQLLDLF